MKNTLLSELFGGAHRYALLRALYQNPACSYTTVELARMTGVDRGNVSRWLRKWAKVGLAKRATQGQHITYQASNDPLLGGLTDMARRSDEILDDIASALPEEAETAVLVATT